MLWWSSILSRIISSLMSLLPCIQTLPLPTDGHFVCACARWVEYFVFGAICHFWTRCGRFLNGWSTLKERSCQERWKIITTLHTFLTLWIPIVFVGTLDEDILMIKVRTERDKSPKKWSLEFDLTKIKMFPGKKQTMKVSLKTLKLYCYESWGYILRRSSDTRSYMRRKFWVWAGFPSTLKLIFIIFPPVPKL